MRVGVDARMAGKEGLGRYGLELIPVLANAEPRAEFVVFLKRADLARRLERRLHHANVRFELLPGALFLPREQLELARSLRRERLDLLHVTFDHGLPWWTPRRVVLTVHDAFPASPLYFRSPWTRRHYQIGLRRGLRRATRILTVSSFVRQELVRTHPELTERVHAVPNGVGEAFRLGDCEAARRVARARYGVEEYLLYIGVLAPHKNVEGLLRAYALLCKKHAEVPPLVMAGRLHPMLADPAPLAARLGIADRVRWLGFVAEAELPDLYRAARLFVFPSLHEGFGIPVLEAMACGTPVVTSDRTALPEVAGDAALLVDPTAPESIAEGMGRVLFDPALATILRERGLQRARGYSWARTGRRVLEIYHELHTQD